MYLVEKTTYWKQDFLNPSPDCNVLILQYNIFLRQQKLQNINKLHSATKWVCTHKHMPVIRGYKSYKTTKLAPKVDGPRHPR